MAIPRALILRFRAGRMPILSQRPLSTTSRFAKDKDKPIVLEQPDKFRPPSHASRRNARSTTGMFGGGAAYNQGMTAKEAEASKTKKYPHMFPAEGTRMYWFLTTRWVHVMITFVVLSILGFSSLFSTWSKTSPYAHLIPPTSDLFSHPFRYVSEILSVYKLHTDYMTDMYAERRRQNILDAQKRRLYRRAHGLEDLEAEEVSGVDIKGLVEWDDGLTNRERERGGQRKADVMGKRMEELGRMPGETLEELVERKKIEGVELARLKEEQKAQEREDAAKAEEERLRRINPEKRRPKLFFGIW